MSRCFPFPPPGYESNHLELFAKENHKEKTHRKEKREKEKREGKERKGKDRSNDKHKEKKDQKEKNKDKKKGKDRDRDTDKGRVPSGRRNDKQREVLNEEKRENRSSKAEDFRFTEELGRRIKDGEKDATDRMLEDIVPKKAGNIGITTKMEKKEDAGNKMVTGFSSIQKKSLGSQFIPNGELRSAAENQQSPNLINTDQKKTDVMAQLVVADRKTTGNGKASKPIFTEQRRNDGLARTLRETDKRVDGNKVDDRDTTNDKRKEHKDKDRAEKRENGKDKDNLKEKEKEKEKMKEKGVYKHKQHNKVPDSGTRNQVDSLNVKALAPPKDNGKNDALQGNSKMRNDFQVNGFLSEADVRPNKLPRTMAFSHLPLENGGTLQPCHLAALSYSATEGLKDANKAELIQEAEENKLNGKTDVRSGLNLRPSPAAEIKKVCSSSKPPHPDCKHLSRLYTVPKMEDWLEFDDQQWLFNNNHLQPKPGPELEAEETPQVWARTMQIDPVNVLALPYVIPY